MADRPIIFSAPMVLALLAGRKTQTRRVLKLPTRTGGRNGHVIYERPDMGGWEPRANGGGGSFTIARDGSRTPCPETVGIWHRTCGVCLDAPYQAGDRLWVREAWQTHCDMDDLAPSDLPHDAAIQYPATYDGWVSRRRSSIHMPRWASRLTLTVTDVRVQKLHDISEEDARAEGVSDEWTDSDLYGQSEPYRYGYSELWNSLHGPDAWNANPWVVAVSFSVERRNIDAAAVSAMAANPHAVEEQEAGR